MLPSSSAEESRMLSKAKAKRAMQVRGIWAAIFFFFVHFNGFAIQETITTPLVQDWYGWSELSANLLFVGAGAANFLCAIALALMSAPRQGDPEGRPRVDDRRLLAGSLVCAAIGWALMVPGRAFSEPASAMPSMPLPQFLISFLLVTVAFPFGRGVCLSVVGKLLGDEPQGAWMGIMFALGALARIAGPFWAVHGYYTYGALAVFGSSSVLFIFSIGATAMLWRCLVSTGEDISQPTPPSSTVKARAARRRSSTAMTSTKNIASPTMASLRDAYGSPTEGTPRSYVSPIAMQIVGVSPGERQKLHLAANGATSGAARSYTG